MVAIVKGTLVTSNFSRNIDKEEVLSRCQRMAAVFIFVLSFISVFTTPATSQLNIVSVRTIEDGSPFTITCNAQRVVTTQTAQFSTISSLQIDIWNNGADGYKKVAQYVTYAPPDSQKEMQLPPAGRNWKFSFNGSNTENSGRNNAATMKIEILVPTGKCEDAGLYKCTMVYFSSGTFTGSSEQNVTSTATTTEPLVILDPVYEAPAGVSNTSTYNVGANVTVTCRFQGPQQLSIKWKRERRPAIGVYVQFDDYTITNDITTDTPTRVPGTSATCPQYSHRSVLRLTISSEDNDRQYQCVVVSGAEEKASSAVLIQVNEAVVTTAVVTTAVVTKPEDIVNVRTIEDGRPFLITCNAQRVVPLQASISAISSLEVDVWNSVAQGFKMVAQYLTYGPPGAVKEIQIPPPGRNWVFSFSGSNAENQGVNNQASMKIEILVQDGKCEDAGLYRCSVSYYSHDGIGITFASSDQNVASTGKTVSPIVTLSPTHNNVPFITNASPYWLGDNITLTCSCQGAEHVELIWKREKRPAVGSDVQYEDYPNARYITISPSVKVPFTSTTCSRYSHASVLHLTVSRDDRNRKYLCVVVSGGLEISSIDALVDMFQ